MKITPVEIRQKTFTKKTLGGIDKEEVAAYLDSLSALWEKILEENKELRIRLESSEKEATKLREVENSLFRTLKAAEETSVALTEQASREAELMIKEAQWKAKTTIEDAEEEARRTFKTLQQEIKDLELEYKNIEYLRDNTLNELRNLAKDISDKIDRVNVRDADSKLSSGKASRQENIRQATTSKNLPKQEVITNPILEKQKPVEPVLEANTSSIAAPAPTHSVVEPKRQDSGSFFDQFN